jgi:ATP-dependent protease ClpP protease subunit
MEVPYMFRRLAVVLSLLFISPAFPAVTVLEKGSFVAFTEEFNSVSASRFIKDFLSTESDSVLVFMDSSGGDVLAGLRMIEAVRSAKAVRPALRVTCYVQSAASMAFYFVQLACDERVLGQTSIMMQHQASVGIRGKLGEVQNWNILISQVIEWLDKEIAARLGLTVEQYKQAIVNDWWLVGQNAVKHKAADRLGFVTCSVELTKAGQCPLVFAPLP